MRSKLKMQLNMPMPFSAFEHFLDFEASGLHQDSYPIEVGVYGSDTDSYESLIVPTHYWTHWDYNSQDIHNIPREELFEKGNPAAEVAAALNEKFAGKILWADSNFDKFWMGVLFEATPYEQKFQIANIYDYLPDQLIGRFKSYLPDVIAHRALQDSIDIKAGWMKFLENHIIPD